MFGTIFMEMFAGLGCFVSALLLVLVLAILGAAKLGFAPGVAKLLNRLTETPDGTNPANRG